MTDDKVAAPAPQPPAQTPAKAHAAAKAAADAKVAQEAKDEKEAADKATQEATDHFAGMHGEYLNAVDALGDSHELRMAKSHATQAMEWVSRHLRPDPSATMPIAPPPAAPRVVE
jgi:hypothetical protein